MSHSTREDSWKEKYHELLHKTVKEIEETSLEAQRQSELNMEASREYIDELKSQLHRSQEKIKQLEERLNQHSTSQKRMTTPISISSDESFKSEKRKRNASNYSSAKKRKSLASSDASTTAKTLNFFESITCLNVQITSNDEKSTVYMCTMDDGILMGHEFELELSYDNWEYTYTPVKPSEALKSDHQFRESFFFPDYMLPRFLVKLLSATYKNENKPL